MKRGSQKENAAILEMWRPPAGAGDPIGCLASTYTFHPGLFDEQCLARFLEIESEPNREDLAFLLERESRLGPVYAGVLVDHTEAGVGHSLRWDVLPVRLSHGKQHAKLSLLVWQKHIRLVVASANLTEQGYRLNQEVCVALDSSPEEAQRSLIDDACWFFRRLLAFVPGAEPESAEIQRVLRFIEQAEKLVDSWHSGKPVRGQRQYLTFSLPSRETNGATGGEGFARSSALDETLDGCIRRGGAPDEVWIASPFYDEEKTTDAATQLLCKSMARRADRQIHFCVPGKGQDDEGNVLLAAPGSLFRTATHYSATPSVEILPLKDEEKNLRPWHAKMLGLFRSGKKGYTALLIGSSNFTFAGMGLGNSCNAEANLLVIAEHLPRARLPGQLEAVWPEMEEVPANSSLKWEGPVSEPEDEQPAGAIAVPAGFLSATFRAGDKQAILLKLDPEKLPDEWSITAAGENSPELLCSQSWKERGCKERVDLPWHPPHPPEKLLVRWTGGESTLCEAFLPLNIEDPEKLPPPIELAGMTADDMLMILAASDPGSAFRHWGKNRKRNELFDEELDSAVPPDLDPLSRYSLSTTFLHRIRSRARILARLRRNLQRPVWSRQALQWRLEGFIGVRPLAERFLTELEASKGPADEALLTLADVVMLLHEVEYEPSDGALSRDDFEEVYGQFLDQLVGDLNTRLDEQRERVGEDVFEFWNRVVQRCRS